ncbi:HlyD family secretion protein [Ferrovum sp. PN-J185]|uniref:HlyD family secretion protein n=1 Tax=Ferrovum sp. PN-J185 TaxID=1356306 RepID=UPI00079C1A11|nr:HlyD family secretion protein [Ferrovum sp. PN-J185]KXW56777.1 putative multidrug resistance protein EmrK [Ferrovum sp. PN-J185]MCC6067729.1 HlyD family secretion protein [Ferrovum sp. PN-J185]MDE2056129.1 HlyD family secretion protein [Betaproteobacteria bacterium]
MSDSTNSDKTTAIPLFKQAQFKRLVLILSLSIFIILFIAWIYNHNRESTDDAFIEANVVQISPHINGYVLQVKVNDNQWVKQGDLLAEIDPRDFQVQVDQAKANLDAAIARHGASVHDVTLTEETTAAIISQAKNNYLSAKALAQQAQSLVTAAEAQSKLAAADLIRYQALFDKDEISRQRLDQVTANKIAASANLEAQKRAYLSAKAAVEVALAKLNEAQTAPKQVAVKKDQAKGGQATVEEAQANLKAAELNLSYTKLIAPVSGHIVRKNLSIGQLVAPGTALLGIVYDAPWVIANFKETQLTKMHPGEKVLIKVDAFPSHEFHGHIDSIQNGTGSRFSLLPPENATGNYVKIVQRVPVKIVFDEPINSLSHLAPGMSVTPTVYLDDNTRL